MAQLSVTHIVEIDEQRRQLSIYRVIGTQRSLFTAIALPMGNWEEDPDAMKQFCQILGENILLDSPQARRLLGISR
jgi:hypothetical protein